VVFAVWCSIWNQTWQAAVTPIRDEIIQRQLATITLFESFMVMVVGGEVSLGVNDHGKWQTLASHLH
jgi:hypothetical protein